MNAFAQLAEQQRREVFQEAAYRLGVVPAIVEKDFWVTWVLAKLFEDDFLSQHLMFKGGTSLSKVYGLIERFSEDIDLILDWQQLTDVEVAPQGSKTKTAKLAKEVNELAKSYIADVLVHRIEQSIMPVCRLSLDSDPFVINVHYPAAFSDSYLRPEIRLEIGPMAAWNPHEAHSVGSLVAQVFPDLFKLATCQVNVILAKRTFWEKATILHAEAHRPENKPFPIRYSRHYYDLARMAMSDVKSQALDDLPLLAQVVAFKDQFYPAAWANYASARPGELKLLPPERILAALAEDYRAMKNMIYGDYLSFETIIATLDQLENEINHEY